MTQSICNFGVGVIRWNRLPGCWQLKGKKNSPLTINDYLLKHSSEIISSSSSYRAGRCVCMCVCVCVCGNCVTFCCIWETDNWGIWLVQSFCYSTFRRVKLLVERFSSRRYFFSYSPVFGMDIGYLLSSNPKNMNFIDDITENEHSRLPNRSQVISYSINFSLIKCADLHLWEENLFRVSAFNCSSAQIII